MQCLNAALPENLYNLSRVTFGEWLQQQLIARGVRPVDLSKGTGINQSDISNYINRGYTPRIDNFARIARFFGWSADELLQLIGLLPADAPPPARHEVIEELGVELQLFDPDEQRRFVLPAINYARFLRETADEPAFPAPPTSGPAPTRRRRSRPSEPDTPAAPASSPGQHPPDPEPQP